MVVLEVEMDDKTGKVIETKSLNKTYQMGDTVVKALDQVSLTISKGELVAITGSSGSGKSTLMNILGCMDRPDSGSYQLVNEKISTLDDDRLAGIRNRYIGFVFQTFNLLPRLTAMENVELPLLYAGYKNAKVEAKKALKMVGLGDRSDHRPTELSGGQRQRVAVARAIVTQPALILADEPTGNLDSKTTTDILTLFQSLHQKGHTIVIITHEDSVADLCEREIVLKDGRVIQQ
jgi:putative ABC transport system ATP-binding protein